MRVSFCQTYGNDRLQLLKIKLKDKKLLEFLNFFDLNIYSFHNCDESVINWFKSNNTIPNTKILINNNITYTQCIKRLLEEITHLNASHFFFYQDDTFSFDNDNICFNNFANFAFNETDLMLTFFADPEVYTGLEIYFKFDSFNIYKSSTFNFTQQNKWSFDDSPYICTTNYLPVIYDDNYLSYSDIWSAEHYLNHNFKQKCINRYTLDRKVFKNYNFLGPNNWNKDFEIKTLTEKGLL